MTHLCSQIQVVMVEIQMEAGWEFPGGLSWYGSLKLQGFSCIFFSASSLTLGMIYGKWGFMYQTTCMTLCGCHGDCVSIATRVNSSFCLVTGQKHVFECFAARENHDTRSLCNGSIAAKGRLMYNSTVWRWIPIVANTQQGVTAHACPFFGHCPTGC